MNNTKTCVASVAMHSAMARLMDVDKVCKEIAERGYCVVEDLLDPIKPLTSKNPLGIGGRASLHWL